MSFGLEYLLNSLKSGLHAAPLTLGISFISFLFSLIFGFFIASCRVYQIRFWGRFFKTAVDIVKAIPGILVIYIVYFSITDGYNAFAAALHLNTSSKDISMNVIAVIALTIMGSAAVSETIRGALLSVPKGQYEAGYSCGLTFVQVFRRVILPQVVPAAIPVLCNNIIIFVKLSSILYFISVIDILNATMIPATANYRFLEAYTAAALLYWLVGFVIEQAAKLLEKIFGAYRKAIY
jgi:L-cystine transport system permease protein